MLTKLLRYEFKASGKILMPIFAAELILSIVSIIFSGYGFKAPENFYIRILYIFYFGIMSFIIASSFMLTLCVCVWRFRSGLFGTEGYLMNTLPVRPSQNIAAKLAASVIFEIISIIVSLISSVIILSLRGYINFKIKLSDVIIFKNFSIFDWLAVFEGILMCLFILIFINIIIFSAISVGSSANSHKILLSIGIFLVSVLAVQLITSTAFNIFNFTGISRMINSSSYELNIDLFIIIAMLAAYSSIFGLAANYFMKKRINI